MARTKRPNMPPSRKQLQYEEELLQTYDRAYITTASSKRYVSLTKNNIIEEQNIDEKSFGDHAINSILEKNGLLISTRFVKHYVKQVVLDFYANLLQNVSDPTIKFCHKVYVELSLPCPSLIFQIMFLQNDKIIKSTKKYEKMPQELKFFHKWLEGKHAPMDLSNVQEELSPTEDTIVPVLVGTVLGSSNTSTVLIRAFSSCFLMILLPMRGRSKTSKHAIVIY
ncbi:hypothetical protein GOBAR_AA26715 [Gossypium barbadense]|uniref:Uncharacterized protein n=1 Tax=Gossypium barbadense TaxID=3634 RepID=A0A2P5WS97_GOSBA|nr:hypothetical protein GOBAR_AA26715 [Gossypium barbadense]